MLQGSVRQAACRPGSFQLREVQGSCEMCPAGSYCQDQGEATETNHRAGKSASQREIINAFPTNFICTPGMTVPLRCERGFYCPRGSANQHPCPPGTYGNVSGLAEERQCTQCDPGMYCKETGTIHPLLWLTHKLFYDFTFFFLLLLCSKKGKLNLSGVICFFSR